MIQVDFWGPIACFSTIGLKAERYSYDVPTPSAVRGMLSAIYSKPEEFWWQVRKIELMKPIRRLSVMTNEVKCKMNGRNSLSINEQRTQRNTVYLKDVYYRITAEIMPRPGFNASALVEQARRRIEKGQCFTQPYMGTRECTCYFSPPDPSMKPIDDTRSLNLMLYDMFEPWLPPDVQTGPKLSLYQCTMVNGVIEVPAYNDPAVIKLPGGVSLA